MPVSDWEARADPSRRMRCSHASRVAITTTHKNSTPFLPKRDESVTSRLNTWSLFLLSLALLLDPLLSLFLNLSHFSWYRMAHFPQDLPYQTSLPAQVNYTSKWSVQQSGTLLLRWRRLGKKLSSTYYQHKSTQIFSPHNLINCDPKHATITTDKSWFFFSENPNNVVFLPSSS